VIWASLVSATAFVALTGTTKDLAASENVPGSVVSEEFVYFPSQYVNKATEPSEPIQGF
jgi:hypothetical protein